ncbi:hypothetical protein BDN72DRAFT_797621 [Pluteus cervinus]|uniref:Uncharacterized protein n=1 Tax=Pluteus cervinus TaxID=181527 RepID=A0ACD3ASA1_9AGAR|nr:hypothetical protein BDN72DRAFT_797621 [Pluteus cervinus]
MPNKSRRAKNVPGSQQNTLGSGGIGNNGTTNNNHDYSQGKTIDNSNNTATYYGSNHYNQTTYHLNTPSGPQPIDILRERACAGAAFDSAERGEPPRCHPDTRTAVLSSGTSWVDNLNAICFFMWITGWAGVGKSAILQTLAEVYQRKMRLAASFFFFQASDNRNTISSFVATIAEQLTHSVPGAREIILHKIASNPTIFVDKSFRSQWLTLVVDTLCRCRSAVPRHMAPMLIVIDGIDEIASREEQRLLLQTILDSAQQLGPSYKFLIASRPEQQIGEVFQAFRLAEESRIELGDDGDTQADLRVFLQASFSRIHQAHNFQSSSPTQAWPGQNVIEHLVNKASGQFVYASTVIRVLESFDNPQGALKIILKGRDVQAKSFKELDYLYLLTMERVEKSMQKEHQHLLHHLLVCIYMHLVREVGDELHLLHPEKSNKDLLKSLSAKLDPILGTNGEYRHKSFIEFLIQPSAPHLFSINSWHLSGVISLCLPVFLENNRDKTPLLCFVERASPTPDLVSCLSKMPEGELSSWDYKDGCKANDEYLWDNKWLLGWLGYQFSVRIQRLQKVEE